MVVFHLDRAATDGSRKIAGSTLRVWPKRLGAAIMLPVVLGLIILKPTWFEQDE